ncbi:MAG: metallophosphoesterase [Deltaproteobacteria bacterium]|nr:metallophosphoesterase [Deltaproteobacteria bacterium]
MLALVILLLGSPVAEAADLVRGPYLQQVTQESVIVVLDLDERATPEVRIAVGTPGEQSFASRSSGRHHEIEVTGLDAATEYAWAVYLDDVRLGEAHGFRTAVRAGTPFSFLVYGDTRTGHEDHGAMIAAALTEEVGFAFVTGDLVSDGEVAEQWDTFFTIEQPLIERIPLYPVVGNHDEHAGDAALFRDAFALPGAELYYSFDHGNAHFVVLDMHVNTVLACRVGEVGVINCLDEEQAAWLEADLREACAQPETDLTFLLIHVGPYTSVADRTGNGHLRALLPLFEETGVVGILSGHDHYYERGRSANDIAYVVSGGAGAPLYALESPNSPPHTIEVSEMVHHYVVVEVDGLQVRLVAKDLSGVVIDDASFDAATTCVATGPDDGEKEDGWCGCTSGAAGTGGGGPLGAVLGVTLLAWRRTRRSRLV